MYLNKTVQLDEDSQQYMFHFGLHGLWQGRWQISSCMVSIACEFVIDVYSIITKELKFIVNNMFWMNE